MSEKPTASRPAIGIIGAGAVGRYVAAHLAGFADVTLVGRAHQQAALESEGIRAVPLAGGEVVAGPDDFRFSSAIGAVAACESVIISVKSAQTAGVARELAAIVTPACLALSFQNGVGNAAALREHLANIAAGIVSFNVVGEDGGVVRQTTDGPLILEALDSPAYVAVVSALASAKLETESRPDIVRRQFTKLVVNLSNAVSALSGVPTRELLLSAGYRRIIAAVADEALDVLAAADIKPATLRGVPLRLLPKILRLPSPIARLVMRSRMKIDPRARSSMWEDLERRRPTEIDYLNGEIVRLAAAHGTRAVLNERLVALVHAAEERGEGSPNLAAAALTTALEL